MAAWELSAVCRQVDPELWYPKPGDKGRAAKRICRTTCSVRQECLTAALAEEGRREAKARFGIRGVLGPKERWRIATQQTVPQPQPAG